MLKLDTLNPQQRLAVQTTRGPVLILAGAGTGKTRVITTRIAHLIQRGVRPGHILGVTFTNKAAREMLERVNQLMPRAHRGAEGAAPERPTVCTFHSLCARILRGHIHHLGYKPNFVIYNESEQLGAIKKILCHISTNGPKADPQAVLSLLSRYKNGGERARVFAEPGVAELAQHIQDRYQTALHACNAVDFDDLILLTLRLFREQPAVLAACRDRYRFVLVDEYQDTNAAQFQLVHTLTLEHRNLCVVGDDDQSIYGWRGAEVANLLDLEQHFPEVKVIKLEQNYRSTETILRAANAVIQHNPRRRPKQLWSQKGTGDKLALSTFANEEEEARSVVEALDFARRAQRAPWSDYAILFRTNNQSRPIETELRKARVRYHLVGGQSYFDRREVRDLLAYLKTCLNPHDDISLLRIANVPARGLSDATMERLLSASHERKCSVHEAMKNPVVQAGLPVKTRESLEAFLLLLDQARARLHQAPPAPNPHALQQWAEGLLDATRYLEEVRRSEKDKEEAQNRVQNLCDLVASLDGESAPTSPLDRRLEAFLESITLDTEREAEQEATGDAVTLITMHSCKGLEFPHVFIVGLEDGLLPHSRSQQEGTLDEERRLFYVALTRAMRTLRLSYCTGRKRYGKLQPCHPSRFLKELPPDLLEHASDRARKPVPVAAGSRYFDVMRAAADEG